MKRRFLKALSLMVICCMVLVGCGGDDSGTDAAQQTEGYDFEYTDREQDFTYDEESAEKITLNNSDVNITEGGTYILSGKLSDGQIIVETADDEKVQLVFNGVEAASSDSAPLYIKECDKVFVTLVEGSENVLTGPDNYSDAATEEGIDGAVYSKGDLCFNGNGNLTVTSSAHGIVSKDDLVITGGIYDIDAAGDGIQGKDCVKIKKGEFNINADNDGIRSSNTEDEYRGFISVDGGDFDITAGYDGIQAATVVRIAGGIINVETGGGSKNSSTDSDWGSNWGGGPGGGMGGPGGHGDMHKENDSESSESEEDEISAKGIKAGLGIMISSGTMEIDSSDDSIHSNGFITIDDGNITMASGDDGVHADSDLVVKAGTINVTKSYEGLEGNTITLDGGSIDITASDDGLNAAGGSDGSSTEDRPGVNDFAADESAYIKINGGELVIHANGDGIDSNGTLDITAGNVTVSCPTSGDTAVLDYGSEGNITGGTFIGTGAVQMAQTFSSSEQGVLAISVGNQSAGAEILITDSDGNEVASYTPDQSFAVVIFSSPNIVSGETYTINIGGVTGDITAS